MKIINLITIFSLGLLIFISSCAKDEGPFAPLVSSNTNSDIQDSILDSILDSETIPEPTVYSYTISFNNDIKPLFKASCVHGCHNPNHPKLDLRPPVAYDQLLTDGFSAPYVNSSLPKSSSLYLHLIGTYTLMPKDAEKLSQGKIDTVYTWISQGTLNN
ncbi:MAG: hypothetical protein ACLGGV_01515 [Bacteroidia bacterium]